MTNHTVKPSDCKDLLGYISLYKSFGVASVFVLYKSLQRLYYTVKEFPQIFHINTYYDLFGFVHATKLIEKQFLICAFYIMNNLFVLKIIVIQSVVSVGVSQSNWE